MASQQLPGTKEQLSRHQEGQFEWLLSIPGKTAATGRRPRSEAHDDAELRQGENTLYFGCNLICRRPQPGGGALENGKTTDVYTLLATRIEGMDRLAMDMDAEIERLQIASDNRLHHGDAMMAGRRYDGLDAPKSPGLTVEVKEITADIGGERSRPVSRIEDSVEALDKLDEEIEALSEVAQLDRVFSPEAATRGSNGTGAKTTPMKRATSVRASGTPAKAKAPERSASVRNTASSTNDGNGGAGSTTSSARKVPRPTSLLPPKPPAKSSRPPTVSTFELPGEAVARRLKEQREQRRSAQISSEQAAALAAAYSPSKPHFKSSKPPTRPTFTLPGEAISRRKREEHEAKLRAQEEEERKRRQFKARPIRASLTPNSVPRETLASLARQKTHGATEGGSSDSATTTVTPASKKRQSVLTPRLATTTAAPTSGTANTLPTRGRDPTLKDPLPAASSRAASTSTTTGSIRSRGSSNGKTSSSAEEVRAQQKLRGREVFARDNAYTAERERERRERETAARVAREQAAERSRELSRLWAEKQRVKREMEKRAEMRKQEAAAVAV